MSSPRDLDFNEILRRLCYGAPVSQLPYLHMLGELHNAAVTRAIRDTREADARELDRLRYNALDGLGDRARWNQALDAGIRSVRALNPTPERLYTEAEKEAAYQAGVHAGALVQQGFEDVKAGRVKSLGSFVQYVEDDDDDSATPTPETGHA